MGRADIADMDVDQERVVRFLADPATHDGAPVKHIQTHISHVFLVGDHAYKMKKAVHLDFVDFSTLEDRYRTCLREIEINARTAPDIYLDVIAVNQTPDGLQLGPRCTPVEYLVRMRRFPQEDLCDRMVVENRLTDGHVREIADAVSTLHLSGHRVGRDPQAEDFETTARTLARRLGALLVDPETRTAIAHWQGLLAAALDRHLPEIRRRARHGGVRHGHGDLHLGNICLFNGNVRLFDAIEFQPRFSHIDILYDVAFAAMDLVHRHKPDLATVMLSRYLAATRDYSGVDLLHLFMSVRAGIRAMVALLGPASDRRTTALSYLQLATDLLAERSTARLILIGGRSGTGKSTVARGLAPLLAPAPGVLILRSDEIRKFLLGQRPEAPLTASAYGTEIGDQVYRRMFRDAARALRNGATVILDAAFLDPLRRSQGLALGRQTNVPVTPIWLDAPTAVLARRLDQRTGDASDADRTVMQHQDTTAPTDPWIPIDASGDPQSVVQRVASIPELLIATEPTRTA